jgi:phosphorylase/glycogen(starch) synthase
MILSNLDRLDRIVNHKTHPVHIVFAGKAHPNDEMGKSILKRVVDVCRDDRFRGKIFFVEDYDIRVARRLVQGVDVWLNNPRRPNEASGTSGEKVIINGVLNMSVSDGWWCEGYDGKNGWVVGPVVRDYMEETTGADEEDAQSLFSLLENTVVPMYYDREVSGIPEKWVHTIKSSMQTLCPKYNTDRMLLEYYHDMYAPTARRSAKLAANSFAMTRQVADWKQKIPLRFSSLRLLDISVEGILGDTILVDKPLRVTVRVDPGKLGRDEILVELMIGEKDGAGSMAPPLCLPLKAGEKASDGILTFQIEYVVRKNGSYFYGIRVLPYRESLTDKQETGLVLWG